MNMVIETRQLEKKYGNKFAVNKVDLHVEHKDIYGLIGKNGAGKTTLMRLILGLAEADNGDILLFNTEELSNGRKKIGSIVEEPGLYYKKTAFENMKTFSLLYDNVSDEEINRILNLVGLKDTGNKLVSRFSLGMKQRLGIAIALMGEPDLLILDEPLNGLDPSGIRDIRDLILKLNKEGVTFLISSHLLDELGKIATKYGIMSDGILVEEISSMELKKSCEKHIEIKVDSVNEAKMLLMQEFPNIIIEKGNEENYLNIISEIEDTSQISKVIVSGGVKLYSMVQQGMAFEDYFIKKLGDA